MNKTITLLIFILNLSLATAISDITSTERINDYKATWELESYSTSTNIYNLELCNYKAVNRTFAFMLYSDTQLPLQYKVYQKLIVPDETNKYMCRNIENPLVHGVIQKGIFESCGLDSYGTIEKYVEIPIQQQKIGATITGDIGDIIIPAYSHNKCQEFKVIITGINTIGYSFEMGVIDLYTNTKLHPMINNTFFSINYNADTTGGVIIQSTTEINSTGIGSAINTLVWDNTPGSIGQGDFGGASNSRSTCASFTAPNEIRADTISFYLRDSSTPTRPINASVWTITGGKQGGHPLYVLEYSNNTITGTTGTLAWYNFTFTNKLNLTAGTDYATCLSTDEDGAGGFYEYDAGSSAGSGEKKAAYPEAAVFGSGNYNHISLWYENNVTSNTPIHTGLFYTGNNHTTITPIFLCIGTCQVDITLDNGQTLINVTSGTTYNITQSPLSNNRSFNITNSLGTDSYQKYLNITFGYIANASIPAINNTPPSSFDLSRPLNNSYHLNNTIYFNWTASNDYENSTLTYTINITRTNGSLYKSETQNNDTDRNIYLDIGNYTWNVKVTDGINMTYSNHTYILHVNLTPLPPSITLNISIKNYVCLKYDTCSDGKQKCLLVVYANTTTPLDTDALDLDCNAFKTRNPLILFLIMILAVAFIIFGINSRVYIITSIGGLIGFVGGLLSITLFPLILSILLILIFAGLLIVYMVLALM